MKEIKIICKQCNNSFNVKRDSEAPKDAIAMWCNWCPTCHENDKVEEDYEEGYITLQEGDIICFREDRDKSEYVRQIITNNFDGGRVTINGLHWNVEDVTILMQKGELQKCKDSPVYFYNKYVIRDGEKKLSQEEYENLVKQIAFNRNKRRSKMPRIYGTLPATTEECYEVLSNQKEQS